MMKRILGPMLAGLALLAGVPALAPMQNVGTPLAPSVTQGAQQDDKHAPAPAVPQDGTFVAKKGMRDVVARSGAGGLHPWINQHGYLLRQVRR